MLRILSFNVHFGGIEGRHRISPYGLESVLEKLTLEQSPIVTALQEMIVPINKESRMWTQGQVVQTTILGYPCWFLAQHRCRSLPKGGGVPAWRGIMFKTSLPVISANSVWLPVIGESCSAARFRVLYEGREVDIFAVHHSSKVSKLAGLRQARAVFAQVDASVPTIIVGDHNFWGPPLIMAAPRRQHWGRAVIGKTWPAWKPHSQIDHIFVSPHWKVSVGHVLPKTPSDHLPVTATMELR